MLRLRGILPPGKLETTIRGLKMGHYDNFAIFDVTADVKIGGRFSPALRGPTPHNLVTAVGVVPAPVPVIDPRAIPPFQTRHSAAANQLRNYLM
jgi:hypothetical protein